MARITSPGPSRPRNDRDDPNRNDTGIFNWLAKRGLNIAEFNKLVEGGLQPHHAGELDCNMFFLSPQFGEGTPSGFPASTERPERMPVLR